MTPKEQFDELRKLRTPQARGRQLEKLANRLLLESGLEPRTAFRPRGEEIDGSFVMDGRVFLLEMKWKKKPIPASDLYAFRGKVDGKLEGTLGVFISMSGYSEEAIGALKAGKSLRILLFNNDDFERVVVGEKELDFKRALAMKLRRASDRGEPFAPLATLLAEAEAT